ncbi:hypothetical protein H4R34_005878 [Dimargaris verticillata]|uniref:Uncharacterized protein n=1 Tax=Dimargaris verticillata TaxID=2761393 RepID=A0A9W8AY71_9FUNG|nr:hypothetical protein H4R34_005878 [Dimargaris verticillata]
MARTTLWFLATVAAVGLARAATLPERTRYLAHVDPEQESPLLKLQPELLLGYIVPELLTKGMANLEAASKLSQFLVKYAQKHLGGKVSYDLRRSLGLPDMAGSSTQVGLRTLLDGAQLEYRGITHSFISYLSFAASDPTGGRDTFELDFPDLFQKYTFQQLDLPPFVAPWLEVEYDERAASPDNVMHSLINLGSRSGNKYIVAVIKALFEMLGSPELLASFQALVGPVPGAQQNFRAFMHQLWLEVIGGGKGDQLQCFLGNMLAKDVIPGIVSQMLRSGRHAEALSLAKQLGTIDGFVQAVDAYPENAPNLFEFVVIYATARRLDGLDTLLPAAQRSGSADVQMLYNCFEEAGPNSPWKALVRTFHLEPLADAAAWQLANEVQCKPLVSKYMRNSYFNRDLVTVATFPEGEDITGLFVPDK